ncbi:class F sortase [Streptomyces sp. HNM0575]|uniref:class F sortase n=1 Tax=Streptomyces sp. HNM0575 TaxID=2716338 RepID=UPI00145D8B41|nr:class F sortase [Streptomyces sp. HNM0575]NLU75629.1 class F sortase [Streptomyces sp. HNM0575]
MTPSWRAGSRTRRWGLLTAAAALAVTAAVLLATAWLRQQPSPPQAPQAAATHRHDADSAPEAKGKHPKAAALPPSSPERIRIPSLGVSSSLETLGLDQNQAMETPRDPQRAGWYEPGTAPGSQGPAVIAGHVTWNGTPAVFHRLGEMKPGSRIEVTRQDGRTALFTVERTARYPKKDFPTIEVYRDTDRPALRLITCGGKYSSKDRYYSDNVVIFASLTSTHR